MLNRQKAVLQLLRLADRPVSVNQLQQWSFLLAHETESHGGPTFYSFVPLRDGPYSFTLARDQAALLRNGQIEPCGAGLFQLTTAGRSAGLPIAAEVTRDIHRIARCYAAADEAALTALLRTSYPHFSNGSDAAEPATVRPAADPAVYTIGYQHLTADAFLHYLLAAGVKRIIDVRHNPVSRRFGFHKSTLARLTALLGMAYVHIPELGIPGSERHQLETAAQFRQLFDSYADSLSQRLEYQQRVGRLLVDCPSALLCMEADPRSCHRNVLADSLSRIVDLPVKHLGWPR